MGGPARFLFVGAFACYLAAEGLTFMYFYPRNAIMFTNELDVAAAKSAWQQWSSMNWVRTLVVAIGICCTAFGLHRVYVQGGVN
jgi:hypothetical protein